MKILFVVIDGLSERPLKELERMTPLEAAKTPNLDYLAKNGKCGLLEPVFTTAIPTSEGGHLALFGYDPIKLEKTNLRRGLFTAKGSGMNFKRGDIALRGNFATVDSELNIVDRRAGRIKNTRPLISALNRMKLGKIKFFIKGAGQHRISIIIRGNKLGSNISDGDPHYSYLGEKARKIIPLDKKPSSLFTARVLNEFLEKASQILKKHSFNKKRRKNGLLPANYILVRGASSFVKLESFKKRYSCKACCIAGKILYKQIAKELGMGLLNVKGANGLYTTNLEAKVSKAVSALEIYDFIFLHIKATDTFGHDGDYKGKKKFLEKIDKSIGSFLKLKDCLIIVTADHSTCCSLKRHCKEPIPFLISGGKKDSVTTFSEKACRGGGFGKIKQTSLIKIILKSART